MHDLKAVLAAADRLERDLTETVEPYYDDTADTKLVAAFVRDYLDETPVGHDDASKKWLADVSPLVDGKPVFVTTGFGGDLNEIFYSDGYQWLPLGSRVTRGRVRAFALGMGLTLREGEG